MKGSRNLSLACGIALVVCLLSVFFRSAEPSYQGKSLSRWLDELPDLVHSEFDADAQIPARDALHHMGTNTLPFLLKRIQARNSPLKIKLIEWAERYDVSALRLKRAEFLREEAAIGLRLLGPKAIPAVPALVKLLRDTNTSPFAAYALAGIDPKAVLSLNNTNSSPKRPQL